MKRFLMAGLLLVVTALSLLCGASRALAVTNDTWTGSALDTRWTNPLNWGVAAPSPNDFLFWGSGQTTASNDFPTGTVFGNITFKKGAASFTLTGNGILLTNLYDASGGLAGANPNVINGSISNLSASAQFLNLPVELMNGYHYVYTTNGNLNVHGPIARDVGGVVTFYTPGSGAINLAGSGLTTNNFNNILGGWAVVNDTNWATLDAGSNVIAASYLTVPTTITNAPGTNYTLSGTAVNVAAGGATINTLRITNLTAGTLAFAAATDVLRLGQNGGIMLANTVGGANWNIGASAGSGIITAGSSGNSELFLCEADPVSSAAGQLTVNSIITDNGGGSVTVVKNGGQNLVFGATNTFSGGTYINQSRIAPTFAGAMGYGPVHVNNGGQLWVRGNFNFTNDVYLSGSGNGESQQFGAVRFNGNLGCTISGTVHVNVSTPKVSNTGTITGRITGTAGMRYSSAAASGTSPTIIVVGNPNNNYAGDTFIWADHFNTYLRLNNSQVIPGGPGMGNLIITNSSVAGDNAILDLNGFNETLNGLISGGNAAQDLVTNFNSASLSTLTIGSNNATATFAGNIGVGNGQVALTKIGSGTQTLSGVNGYAGNTTITGGTLALTGSGSIAHSANVVVSGATLDISKLTTLATTVGPLATTNAALSVVLNPSVTNVTTTTLTTGGTTNLVNIAGVTGLGTPPYPAQFTVIAFTTFNSNSFFGFGTVPSPTTQGYFTNTGSAIVLVLTNGPKPITWVGNAPVNPTNWDIATTTNWLFASSPVPFNIDDSVTFNESAASFKVDVTTTISPGAITVSNAADPYIFSGPGSIGGLGGLTKQGTGSLTLLESGDSFSGLVNVTGGSIIIAGNNTISGGMSLAAGTTVQVGTGAGAGTLPGGNVVNNGSLLFMNGGNLTVPNVISGSGTLTNNSAGVLALNGANTFTGPVAVLQGTVQMGSAGALGAVNPGTFISSGATLDVNGYSVGGEPIFVQGPGVGNSGAVVNSGVADQTALMNVTLQGNTTFGGAGRWDVRSANINDPTQGSLLTGGNSYNLTKTGPNQVSLVGITVDGALANIDVPQGILSVESAITGVGDPTKTLTVEAGATLQLFQLAAPLSKSFVLNGDGITTTLNDLGGSATLAGLVTFNGNCLVGLAGTSLTLSAGAAGTGSMAITGAGTLFLQGTSTYTGNISLTQGTLEFDSVNAAGSGTLTTAAGSTLQSGASGGGFTGAIQVGGIFSPGENNQVGTFTSGPLTLTNSTLSHDFTLSGKDQIQVNGGLVLQGTNLIIVNPADGSIHSGDQVNLITYTGSLTGGSNNFAVATPPPGYSWTLLDPATTPGVITLSIVHVPVNQTWVGGNPNNVWDTTNTANWQTNSVFDTFSSGDNAIFNDTAATKTVSVTGTNLPEDMNFQNSTPYTLTGTGKITGPGTLEISGGGLVQFANTGTNDFSGAIGINNGILSIGNGGVGGNVGPGTNTVNGTLVFNRSDDFAYPNSIISGTGVIDKTNTDSVSMNGSSPQFTGTILVDQGTLRVGASTALGTNNSGIFVRSGATLDFPNPVNINVGGNGGGQVITIAGAGVTNGGAIINSSNSTAATGANFANVTLTNDLTIGGVGRLDWYGVDLTSAGGGTLNTFGHPYNLFKVGGNQLEIQAIFIDAGFGNFIVQGGTLGFQGNLPSLGNVSSNLIVGSNCTLSFFQVSNVLYKTLILSNTATVFSQSGSNLWGGPVVLNGSNNFNISSWLGLSNTISGSGELATTAGSSILYLPASNTYTGPTYLNAGTLALVFDPNNNGGTDGSITHSSLIYDSATLDVTGRSDQTLTVVSGQTLQGDGTVNGTLVAASGSTVSPGATTAPARLTVTTNATLSLGSATLMRVSESPRTNDQLRVTRNGGTINYGGSLTVTISSGNMHGGEVFPLFSASNLAGSFSPINLPTLGPGLSWNTSALGTTGNISVTGTLTPPTISTMTFIAPTLSLSGTGGSPNGPYVVITSTNLTNALSTWTPVVTNHFANDGSFSWSGNAGSTNAQQFFTIRE